MTLAVLAVRGADSEARARRPPRIRGVWLEVVDAVTGDADDLYGIVRSCRGCDGIVSHDNVLRDRNCDLLSLFSPACQWDTLRRTCDISLQGWNELVAEIRSVRDLLQVIGESASDSDSNRASGDADGLSDGDGDIDAVPCVVSPRSR